MNFLGEDPFEDIVREFFGGNSARGNRRKQFITGEEEDRTTDFIEDEKNIYVIFELSGYDEKDLQIIIKGNELKVIAKKQDTKEMETYLTEKLSEGTLIQKTLPGVINTKKFSHTMRNGVLEITFDKKKGGNGYGSGKVSVS